LLFVHVLGPISKPLRIGLPSRADWLNRDGGFDCCAPSKSWQRDPHSFPQAEEFVADGLDLRELLIGRRRGIVHRVLFTIESETVTIHRVRHASQDQMTEDDV